jgi:uncharacterized membrane protein YcaP (DUF421 family)
MKMLNRDKIFIIIVITWLISNVISYICFKSNGVTISNFSWMILMLILVIFKTKSRKFNNWLEK